MTSNEPGTYHELVRLLTDDPTVVSLVPLLAADPRVLLNDEGRQAWAQDGHALDPELLEHLEELDELDELDDCGPWELTVETLALHGVARQEDWRGNAVDLLDWLREHPWFPDTISLEDIDAQNWHHTHAVVALNGRLAEAGLELLTLDTDSDQYHYVLVPLASVARLASIAEQEDGSARPITLSEARAAGEPPAQAVEPVSAPLPSSGRAVAPEQAGPTHQDLGAPAPRGRGSRWWYVAALLPAVWALYRLRRDAGPSSDVPVLAIAVVVALAALVAVGVTLSSRSIRARSRAARDADPTAVVRSAAGDRTTAQALAELWRDPQAGQLFRKPYVVVADSHGVRLVPGRGEPRDGRLIARQELRAIGTEVIGVSGRPTPVVELTVLAPGAPQGVRVPLVVTKGDAGVLRAFTPFVEDAAREIRVRVGML